MLHSKMGPRLRCWIGRPKSRGDNRPWRHLVDMMRRCLPLSAHVAFRIDIGEKLETPYREILCDAGLPQLLNMAARKS
ncbi:MAG: hypothetical protein JWN34_5471 [Bryobacterales bacterium]|nr:hypothetical protein [Bryobacterales bacterium]